MGLYRKTLFFVSLALILLTVILYFASHFVILHSFRDLECDYTLQSITRMQSVLRECISELNSTCADWAEWDDTYAFVHGGNPDYLRVNMVDPTFANLKLNGILIVAPDGKILYSKAYDLVNNRAIPVPAGLREHLTPGSLLLRPRADHGASGIIPLADGPAFIASRAILTSKKQGPSAGVMIMVRFLDGRAIRGIAQIINHPVSILPLHGSLAWEGKEILPRVSNAPFTFATPKDAH
jgi:sensor domain CHASE-containing protein